MVEKLYINLIDRFLNATLEITLKLFVYQR